MGSPSRTHSKSQVLHHAAHSANITHASSALAFALSSEQILNAPVGVNLHGAEVVEPLNQTCVLAELLAEGIAKVVGGIGGYQQDRAADFGELDGKTAGRGGLADTTLAADENPPQTPLVEDGLEGGLHGVRVVGVDDRGRHFCELGGLAYKFRTVLWKMWMKRKRFPAWGGFDKQESSARVLVCRDESLGTKTKPACFGFRNCSNRKAGFLVLHLDAHPSRLPLPLPTTSLVAGQGMAGILSISPKLGKTGVQYTVHLPRIRIGLVLNLMLD